MRDEENKSDYLRFLEDSFVADDTQLEKIFSSAIREIEEKNAASIDQVTHAQTEVLDALKADNTKLRGLLETVASKQNENNNKLSSLSREVDGVSSTLRLIQGLCFLILGMIAGFAGFVIYG